MTSLASLPIGSLKWTCRLKEATDNAAYCSFTSTAARRLNSIAADSACFQGRRASGQNLPLKNSGVLQIARTPQTISSTV
jgi:hypothetical protein